SISRARSVFVRSTPTRRRPLLYFAMLGSAPGVRIGERGVGILRLHRPRPRRHGGSVLLSPPACLRPLRQPRLYDLLPEDARGDFLAELPAIDPAAVKKTTDQLEKWLQAAEK